MLCRFCNAGGNNPLGTVPSAVLSLPEDDNPDSPFGCRICMVERGLWCPVHDVPHSQWSTGGHLCLKCLLVLYDRLLPRAEDYYAFLTGRLPDKNARAIRDWAEDPENWIPLIPPRNAAELVLWSVSALALIRNVAFKALITSVADNVDLEQIIPRGFPISIP